MKNIIGLSHINIVVENIERGVRFYEELLGAVVYQKFPKFKNEGFAKAAGFLEMASEISVSIAFLKVPSTPLVLELMEYHTPKTTPIDPETIRQKDVTTVEGVKHIALSVRNIETEFSRVKKIDGVTFINKSLGYEPCKIDDITINDFEISGENVVGTAKEEVQRNISNTWYFYFLDKYGVQWEFEQGHVDLIN
ncbi:bleomycin resistance protein [Listeria grandensis]|uniref:Bleomycin resistance protein n=1 Tax=Listeria grandensis TaxID=1494963 RepID=A0A7X0Y2T9_9LIST|nr:VOC family protein [Listeria grandensis]MBC1474430.1 bleomycin resistance protein [Listeria grandensis]MBC1935975.1 bleomycin resistance protein [Listeria grandensis]